MKYFERARTMLNELGIKYAIIHWANKDGFMFRHLCGNNEYISWR